MSYNKEIESYGYVVKDDKQIYTKKEIFYAYDKNEYIVRTNLQRIYENKTYIPFIHKNNIYSIDNIKLWLFKHDKHFILLSTIYESNKLKMEYKCNICNHTFYANFSNIQIGTGCPMCSIESSRVKRASNKEEFINKAKQIHGTYYNYENVVYRNAKEKVEIICPQHGSFLISPEKHLYGCKCKLCSYKEISESQFFTQEKVIADFKSIHNNTYNYDKFIYKGNHVKSIIICDKHGEFEISYSNHVKGIGCRWCAFEFSGWTKTKWVNAGKRSKKFDSYKVYILKCWNESELFYKIGRTFQSVSQRFHGYNEMPYNYEVLQIIENTNGDYIFDLENHLHRLHHQNKLKYIPLIEFGGMYECFKNILNINEILLDFNNTICNI